MKPLSPHLFIYKLPLTALLSITHRFSGLAFILALSLFIVAFYGMSVSVEYWQFCKRLFYTTYGHIWVWPLLLAVHYHALNGLRYLYWSLGHGLELKAVNWSGYVVVTLASALTLTLYLLTH